MKVSDLARELEVGVESLLDTLRSLKFKAKDGDQELNIAVITVIKSRLGKLPPEPPKKKVVKKKSVVKKVVKKKAVKKKAVKKKAVKSKTAETDKTDSGDVTKKKAKVVKKASKVEKVEQDEEKVSKVEDKRHG